MAQVLFVRETLIRFFKRYEAYILPVVKFLFGVYVFHKINGIGFINPALTVIMEENLPALPLAWLLGFAFVLLPYSVSWLIMILSITLQYSATPEVAAVVFLFLLLVYLLYARMAERESVLILFTVLAFQFNIPYLLPVLVGLYCAPTSVIPVALGVFIHSHIPTVQNLMVTTKSAGLELSAIPASLTEVYSTLAASLGTTQSWMFTAFLFAMVILVVYVVSRLSVDFAKELSIILGGILVIFGFIMAILIFGEDRNIGGVIFGTLFCTVLAGAVRLFDPILDYQRAEAVQFEDENNYYYVRVVPKITMTKRKRSVRRIRPAREDREE